MPRWLQHIVRWPRSEARHCTPFFYNESANTSDAVVFVHGLRGDFVETWKLFPKLIHEDPDLPRIDLLLWGYEARLRADVNTISSEARRLMSDLRVRLPNAKNIFLIGHSMGGLAILQGLIDEMQCLRAREMPVEAVRHVVLFATPTLGSQLAGVIKLLAGKVPFLRRLVTRQVKDLCPTEFCGKLVGEIANRLYQPKIKPGDENGKRSIPVTACIGLCDDVVKEESAKSVFHEIPPVFLDCDHFSIKEPESRGDARYLVVKNVLATHYICWFHRLCAQARNTQGAGCLKAAQQLRDRLAHPIDERLKASRVLRFETLDPAEQEEARRGFLSLVIHCAEEMPDALIELVLNAALREFA